MPVIIAIVVAIVGFIGFFVYSTVQENKKQEAIEQYREDAAAFHSTTLSSGSDMEDIGNAIQTAWGKYVNNSRYGAYYNGTYLYSVDDAVEAAQKEQAEKISDVISGDSNIQSLYKALLVIPDPEDQELQEIKEAVKEVYDAYEDMYGVVINVSGNYNSFKSDFGDTDSELADALGKLRNLLN